MNFSFEIVTHRGFRTLDIILHFHFWPDSALPVSINVCESSGAAFMTMCYTV